VSFAKPEERRGDDERALRSVGTPSRFDEGFTAVDARIRGRGIRTSSVELKETKKPKRRCSSAPEEATTLASKAGASYKSMAGLRKLHFAPWQRLCASSSWGALWSAALGAIIVRSDCRWRCLVTSSLPPWLLSPHGSEHRQVSEESLSLGDNPIKLPWY
jgi:hypothetical protein